MDEEKRQKEIARRNAAQRRRRAAEVKKRKLRLILAAGAVVLVLIVILLVRSCGKNDNNTGGNADSGAAVQQTVKVKAPKKAIPRAGFKAKALAQKINVASVVASANRIFGGGQAEEAEAAPVAVVQAAPDARSAADISFDPTHTENTDPDNYIEFTDIVQYGDVLSSNSDYEAWYNFDFKAGESYTDVDGIVTFRGNNFRDTSAYGIADITQGKMEKVWTRETGTLECGDKIWSGNGWTGQPLMMKWPRDVKQHMNMTEEAKANDDLVEVIYAGMDGNVYFMDLETGEKTRDPMYLGFTFKGAGALDPRGYPILYVGAGYNSNDGVSRVFIINLIDCEVMYTFGNEDPFSIRGALSFFDASPLVDAASDTLIWPGENGILYLYKLNTEYDPASGSLSIDPSSPAKWRYSGYRNSSENFWWGMEDSPAIFGHYLFICDNGGYMMCLDLNNLQLVWVQDILDDSNGTPMLSIEDGKLYVYISTSFHLGWRSYDTATVPIWKLDAETGEIVWHTDYECYSDDGISGGVQSTIGQGKNMLSDYVYVTVSKTGDNFSGKLVCLNKKTGEVVWEHTAAYAWSSPLILDRGSGKGYVLYVTAGGSVFLLDGETGEECDTYDFGEETIEATPACYNDMVVFGTRDCHICGFRLS